jgi:chemotaxis protein MotB
MAEQDPQRASAQDRKYTGLAQAGSDRDGDDNLGEGAGWLATYADMVTLLFAFFVLLFAMSSTQQDSFKELIQSLRSALGVQMVPEAGTREGLVMHQIPEEEPRSQAVDEAGGMVQKELDEIVSQVHELIMFNQLGGKVRVVENATGAIITISDLLLFPAGRAQMSEEGLRMMKKIYKILSQFSYRIKIAGHTDNVPIRTEQFASNWELSANRACEVVRFLIENGIDPRLISAEGFAEYRPVASNDTPDGRAQNRRVEIIYERQAIQGKMMGGEAARVSPPADPGG